MNTQKPFPRRRRLFPRPLDECVDQLLATRLTQEAKLQLRLNRDWKEIVGAETASCSQPQKLTFPKGKTKDGVLHVAALGACALTMQYKLPDMMEKLAVYFGYRAVSRITIQQVHALTPPALMKPLVEYKPAPAITLDPDTDVLQKALYQLGQALEKA